MAIPPEHLYYRWPAGAEGDGSDPYVIAYMAPSEWLWEMTTYDVQLYRSPRSFAAACDFDIGDCVQVEVRFRALIVPEELKRGRADNEVPPSELLPLREHARQSLRDAFTILRDILRARADQGHFGAAETLSEQIWHAETLLECKGAPPDVPLRRVVLENLMRTLERGARHLDLPADFWRAMLAATDHLGLIKQHQQYQKLLESLERA